MTTRDTPPLTDKELDILEELWNSNPSWAKDSLLVLRDLRRVRGAVGPFVRLARGLREDYIGEGILYVSSRALRVPNTAFTVGDLRRLTACLPERSE